MINDPRTISQSDLPLIVFSDVTNDWVAFLIKWRTKGDYDHTMVSRSQGKFVCQDFSGYHEVTMDKYLKAGNRLKFVSLVNVNPSLVSAFNASIEARLSLPWWRKGYDWIGIIGQAVGLPGLHTPGLEYCSEDVVCHLKKISYLLPHSDQLIINSIGNQWNPQQLEAYCQQHPETFFEFGKWESDDGIVV